MPNDVVRAELLRYLGGDVVTPGQASVHVTTLPTIATCFSIRANGGDVYFEINGTAASANSPGFVASGTGDWIGPLDNLNRLDVYSAGGVVHLMFYKQHGAWG